MAFKLAERVRETTSTTGTGTIDLAGATLAMRTFVAGIGTGNTTRYLIVSGDGVNWEIGTGTVTDASPDTLSRTPEISTNANAAIALAGESRVSCVYPASLDLLLDTLYSSTRGTMLYRGASVWLPRAPGSTGQVLTMGANDPEWATPGAASPMTLISTLTASGGATLDFTGLSGTTWKLVGRLLLPSSNGATPWIRFGTGGGPTFSAAGYNYSQFWWGSSASNAGTNGEAAAQLVLAGTGVASSGTGLSFEATITTDNANWVMIHGTAEAKAGDTHYYHISFGGVWPTSVALTGIRLLESTGNVTSGTLSLYGIAQ